MNTIRLHNYVLLASAATELGIDLYINYYGDSMATLLTLWKF